MQTASFTKKLLAWHKTVHRPMPWKGEKDPYLIWLSEIILQQTRVEQGLPYFLKFKKRFPEVRSLAEAHEDEVLRLWQGLGYYTRARNLHAAAKYVHHDLSGKFPADFDGIRQLKGVGDYTAAAIASFAYNLPHAVVDGNVFRVLSRYFGIKTPVDLTEGKQQIKALAEKLISKKYPAQFNQAIMDFGAVQCVPANPDCGRCPLKNDCVALKKDLVQKLPVKSKKIKQTQRYFYYLVIREGAFTYISRRAGKDIWKGLFEFPMMESEKTLTLKQLVNSTSFKQLFNGISVKEMNLAGELQQTLSHQKIQAAFYNVVIKTKLKKNGFLRVNYKTLDDYAFPVVVRKFLDG